MLASPRKPTKDLLRSPKKRAPVVSNSSALQQLRDQYKSRNPSLLSELGKVANLPSMPSAVSHSEEQSEQIASAPLAVLETQDELSGSYDDIALDAVRNAKDSSEIGLDLVLNLIPQFPQNIPPLFSKSSVSLQHEIIDLLLTSFIHIPGRRKVYQIAPSPPSRA
jgi:hypothetical protein